MAKYRTVIIENLSLSKKIMQDLDIKTKHIFYTLFSKMQGILGGLTGQTHFNPNIGRTLHDGVYLFPRETRRRYAAPKSNAFTLGGLNYIRKTTYGIHR